MYEFADYTPERFSLEGPGKVVDADVRPEDGVLAFQLEGTTEASRLFVHIPPFPNWRATDGNGEELHIERSRFGNFGARMVVPATGDTIALHYETPPVNRWSGGISILAWALLLGLGWRPLRAQVVSSARILSGIPLIRDSSFIPVAGALGGLMVLFLFLRPLPNTNGTTLLADAEVWVETEDGKRKDCPRIDGKFRCSEEGWNTVHRTETRVGKVLRRCVWAHPPRKGSLHIRWSNIRDGKALNGFHGLADGSFGRKKRHGSTRIGVRLNDQQPRDVPLSRTQGWHPWRLAVDGAPIKSVEWIVRAEKASKQHYCLDWDLDELSESDESKR